MTYDETVRYLYGLQYVGIKLGLDNISRLLAFAGSPQNSFRSIHVAGTNGKGSVCALAASLFQHAGRRVGLFTSPHLVSFTERIQVNGSMISEADVVRIAGRFIEFAEGQGLRPTFFEITTAAAFQYFREQGVDLALVEVGLGGRLDSTNVIRPEVTVITNVGLDHQQYLGDTIESIAYEKAGIIKSGVPTVTAARGPALAVIRNRAREAGTELRVLGEDFEVGNTRASFGRTCIDYSGTAFQMKDVCTSLWGAFQAENLGLALAAAESFDPGGIPRENAFFSRALDLHWPGRLEVVSRAPLIILDGAHNAEAAEALAASLRGYLAGRRILLILGMMADKRTGSVLASLGGLAHRMILTAPQYARAARPEELRVLALELGFEATEAVPSVAEALTRARAYCGPDDVIVVTGSFYTTGEAKEVLSGPGVLTRLRE